MRPPQPFFFFSVLLLVGPGPLPTNLTADENVSSSTTSDRIVVPTLFPKNSILSKGPFIASRGSQGYRGNRGSRGDRGPRGCRGVRGEEGAPGREGYQGIRGPAGTLGPTGPQGEPSQVTGPEGPRGPLGPQGIRGPVGPQGPSSICINHKKPFIWEEFISGNATSGSIGSLSWFLPVGTTIPNLPRRPWKNHPGIISLSGGALLRLSPPPVGTIFLSDPIDVRMVVRVNTDLQSTFGFFATGIEAYLAFTSMHSNDNECSSSEGEPCEGGPCERESCEEEPCERGPCERGSCEKGPCEGEPCEGEPCEESPQRGPVTWHIQAARPDSNPVDCDTGIPVTQDWVTLRIFRPCAYHSVFFYINNMFVHMIPAVSVPEGPIGFKIGSVGCCPDISTIDVDYVSFHWPNLNR